MNIYLFALIGLIAMSSVGYVMFGQLYKEVFADEDHSKPDMKQLAMVLVAMFLISLGFASLYSGFEFSYTLNLNNMMKGLYLGLIFAAAGFALPLMIDGQHFMPKPGKLTAVIVNWVASFIVLGLLAGWLL